MPGATVEALYLVDQRPHPNGANGQYVELRCCRSEDIFFCRQVKCDDCAIARFMEVNGVIDPSGKVLGTISCTEDATCSATIAGFIGNVKAIVEDTVCLGHDTLLEIGVDMVDIERVVVRPVEERQPMVVGVIHPSGHAEPAHVPRNVGKFLAATFGIERRKVVLVMLAYRMGRIV